MQFHGQELSEGKFVQKGGVKGASSPQQGGRVCCGVAENLLPVARTHSRAGEEGEEGSHNTLPCIEPLLQDYEVSFPRCSCVLLNFFIRAHR